MLSALNGPAKLRKAANSLPKHELLRAICNRRQAQRSLFWQRRIEQGLKSPKRALARPRPTETHRNQSRILEKQMAYVFGLWWNSHANKLGRRWRVLVHVWWLRRPR
jgi:hypothetical protein